MRLPGGEEAVGPGSRPAGRTATARWTRATRPRARWPAAGSRRRADARRSAARPRPAGGSSPARALRRAAWPTSSGPGTAGSRPARLGRRWTRALATSACARASSPHVSVSCQHEVGMLGGAAEVTEVGLGEGQLTQAARAGGDGAAASAPTVSTRTASATRPSALRRRPRCASRAGGRCETVEREAAESRGDIAVASTGSSASTRWGRPREPSAWSSITAQPCAAGWRRSPGRPRGAGRARAEVRRVVAGLGSKGLMRWSPLWVGGWVSPFHPPSRVSSPHPPPHLTRVRCPHLESAGRGIAGDRRTEPGSDRR